MNSQFFPLEFKRCIMGETVLGMSVRGQNAKSAVKKAGKISTSSPIFLKAISPYLSLGELIY